MLPEKPGSGGLHTWTLGGNLKGGIDLCRLNPTKVGYSPRFISLIPLLQQAFGSVIIQVITWLVSAPARIVLLRAQGLGVAEPTLPEGSFQQKPGVLGCRAGRQVPQSESGEMK